MPMSKPHDGEKLDKRKRNPISGIYMIRHLSSGKVYIGSSQNVIWRWQSHINGLKRGRHECPRLQSQWNIDGQEQFVFSILEECPINKLLLMEQKWIDQTRAGDPIYGFNQSAFASAPFRGRKHSPETLKKMSLVQMGHPVSAKARMRMSDAAKVKTFTASHRANMSIAQKGRVHTAETKAKISAALSGEENPMKDKKIASRVGYLRAMRRWHREEQ